MVLKFHDPLSDRMCPMRVFAYFLEAVSTGKQTSVLFVMHGVNRNAEEMFHRSVPPDQGCSRDSLANKHLLPELHNFVLLCRSSQLRCFQHAMRTTSATYFATQVTGRIQRVHIAKRNGLSLQSSVYTRQSRWRPRSTQKDMFFGGIQPGRSLYTGSSLSKATIGRCHLARGKDAVEQRLQCRGRRHEGQHRRRPECRQREISPCSGTK